MYDCLDQWNFWHAMDVTSHHITAYLNWSKHVYHVQYQTPNTASNRESIVYSVCCCVMLCDAVCAVQSAEKWLEAEQL